MTSARRRTAAAAAVVVLGVLASTLALLVSAAPAQASAYRYWTYWWGKPDATAVAGWTFANLGPAGRKVADRSVEGWRFAVSTTTGGKQPRTSASYEDHCSDPAADGKVRAAVVVDYGTTSDAPPGQMPPGGGTVRVECLTLPSGSTGLDALRAAGVSYDIQKGLVCSLDAYPRNECAAVVADPTPTKSSASPKPTPSASRTTATAAASTGAAAPDGSTSARPTTSTDRTSAPATTSTPATTSAPAAATSAPAVVASTEAVSPEAEATLPVSSGSPVAAAPEQDGGGSAGGFVVGALVALGIGGAAWWTARGRSV